MTERLRTKKTNLATKVSNIDLKSMDADSGEFTGYGSIFGNVDSHREIVKKGAFSKSLAKSGKFPMLWSHESWTPPIGVFEEAKEDDRGLFVKGQMNLEDPLAQRVHWSMKNGTLTGLSIGYIPKVFTNRDEKTGIRELREVDLKEISVVLYPSNEESRTEAVKDYLVGGELPPIRMFEKFLREAGYSKTQAAAIVTRGYAHLHRSESDSDDDELLAGMSKALTEFRLPTIK